LKLRRRAENFHKQIASTRSSGCEVNSVSTGADSLKRVLGGRPRSVVSMQSDRRSVAVGRGAPRGCQGRLGSDHCTRTLCWRRILQTERRASTVEDQSLLEWAMQI